MLTNKDFELIREELDFCHNPLIFFHDDPDGLCSFLLLYRYKQAGHGIPIKTDPKVDEKFLRKVEEYNPDKIFIVDLNYVSQEFVDGSKKPIVIIDHHTPIKVNNAKYFNPRTTTPDKHMPTSQICYQAVQQDLWIAMCGIIGDWFLPEELAEKFIEEYPGLLDKNIKEPDFALFETEISKVIRMMQFSLKGNTDKVKKNIKVWTRIKDPYEILEKKTPQSVFLYKHFELVNKEYQSILKDAESKAEDGFLIYTYPKMRISLSGELSNELLHRHKDKIILIARKKEHEYKCSLRSPEQINIKKALDNALVGTNGYGGGHEHACGATVPIEQFEVFVAKLKDEVQDQRKNKNL